MIIEKTTGCTINSFIIDDKEICDIDKIELRKILDTITQKCIEENGLQYTVMGIMDCLGYDEYESTAPCETCGDCIDTIIWRL